MFYISVFQVKLGTCHYSARGGGALFWGEGHNFFPSCLGEGQNFFQGFLGEGHKFFKAFFLEKKITNTLMQRELVFASYLFCPFSQRKNVQRAETKRSLRLYDMASCRVKPIDQSCSTVTYNVFITCNHSIYL